MLVCDRTWTATRQYRGCSVGCLHYIRGLRGIVRGGLVDLLRRHGAGDVAHLLTDVVGALTRSECLKLLLHVNLRLSLQPRAAGLVVQAAMTGAAGRDATDRCAIDHDAGLRKLPLGMVGGKARQVRVIGGEISHVL